jgi:hypothetical protein
MKRNALIDARVRSGGALADPHHGRLLLVSPGRLVVETDAAERHLTESVEVVPSPRMARLEVTVTGDGLEAESALTYSWLPLERVDARTFRGVFRLPVGLRFDGKLTRHSDSHAPSDPDGRPIRWPLDLISDHRIDISVTRWIPTPDPI